MRQILLVGAPKQTWHPNAYLKSIRNVRSGLSARTKILVLLDAQGFSAAKIASQSKLSYGVVMYHLTLLKLEGTVERKGLALCLVADRFGSETTWLKRA